METDFEMEVKSKEEAKRELGAARARSSKYEPIAETWREIDDGETILLSGLEQNEIQSIRNLLYRRFGTENVIVRSARQDDDTYKALVREREGREYLRDTE